MSCMVEVHGSAGFHNQDSVGGPVGGFPTVTYSFTQYLVSQLEIINSLENCYGILQ